MGRWALWAVLIWISVHVRATSNLRQRSECSCGDWGKWHAHDKHTPPCCRQNTIRALKSLTNILGQNNISYSLMGGTLLGAVRCGEFIKYDYDADIDMYTSVSNAKKVLTQWHQTSDIFKHMRVTVGPLPWGQRVFAGSKPGSVHLDIGVKQVVPDLVPCIFEDVVMTCRSDYENILNKKYGSDWLVPHRWERWPKKLSEENDTTLSYCTINREKMRQAYPRAAVAVERATFALE